jgi:hypothetical protein
MEPGSENVMVCWVAVASDATRRCHDRQPHQRPAPSRIWPAGAPAGHHRELTRNQCQMGAQAGSGGSASRMGLRGSHATASSRVPRAPRSGWNGRRRAPGIAGYPGFMSPTPRRAEVHKLVDRLPAGQLEALYTLLRGMVPDPLEAPAVPNDASASQEWHPSPDSPVVRALSVVGIAEGDPDLGTRSEEILRQELGHRD